MNNKSKYKKKDITNKGYKIIRYIRRIKLLLYIISSIII